ncbi:cytochrome P450 94A2-like [Andrographis paniculata]|uniref:cytochrome P450 94A2-like n=1 Tax=Andrographis paniculata TaxID=175694 RepID=UPI0021E73716|nr:cytochrome P450 94A2-like [Andrographis paniculata]
MADLDHYFSICLLLLLLLVFPLVLVFRSLSDSSSSSRLQVPIAYPIFGSIFQIWKNKERRVQWIADIVNSTPNLTFTLHRPFGYRQIFTGNAANVEHMLKSHFHNYHKGEAFRRTLADFLGGGIFNADGDNWKFQRQVSSHQFSAGSLRKFVETVVDSEIGNRLIPVMANAAASSSVLDLQDVLQRFAFDNICIIAFGYDPSYLSPSLPVAEFAVVFDQSLKLISERFNSNIPFTWKIKRALGVGKEKQLKIKVGEVRKFAKRITRKKILELSRNSDLASEDLLTRFLQSGHSDEDLITDVVISFIIAGRDTTSAALTWFFWLIHNHPEIETEIITEINELSEKPIYDGVKNMIFTHASLCEAMRLYPPVPVSTKSAINDDVLPDGTVVKKGTRISYHPYAMGRSEKVWGSDWAEFRPRRWLQAAEDGGAGKWRFVGRDSFTYPVFQAGPRVCLGKEMAFLQMKRVVAAVLRRFKVAPAAEAAEPVYVSDFTSKMKGGFRVRVEERTE